MGQFVLGALASEAGKDANTPQVNLPQNQVQMPQMQDVGRSSAYSQGDALANLTNNNVFSQGSVFGLNNQQPTNQQKIELFKALMQ